MALNRELESATRLSLPVPEGTVSGDPLVLSGGLPCVAVTDRDEWTEGEASVQTDGAFRFPVAAEANAITPGEIVYRETADGDLTNDATGAERFGYALGSVDNGQTTEIVVKIGY
jgi:predicted RecA/RadA family phage recombinase